MQDSPWSSRGADTDSQCSRRPAKHRRWHTHLQICQLELQDLTLFTGSTVLLRKTLRMKAHPTDMPVRLLDAPKICECLRHTVPKLLQLLRLICSHPICAQRSPSREARRSLTKCLTRVGMRYHLRRIFRHPAPSLRSCFKGSSCSIPMEPSRKRGHPCIPLPP